MKGEELGKLLMDELLVTEDGRLVTHEGAHFSLECVHVLAHGDLVLLGLIQYASNRVVRSYTWSFSVVDRLTGSSS